MNQANATMTAGPARIVNTKQSSLEHASAVTPYQGERWNRLFNMDLGTQATPKTTGVKPISLAYLKSQRQSHHPANKLFLDPRGNLLSEKDVISKEFGQLIMGENASRQNPEFYGGKTGDYGSGNKSILQMSDAFTYNGNGFGAASPGLNRSKNGGTPKGKIF